MPTISQLPVTQQVSPYDVIPISQEGGVYSISVGELLSATQPAIIIKSSSLLGRISVGAGSPEEIEVGVGLGLSNATLTANGADHSTYPSASSLPMTADLVISNQGAPMLMPTQMLRTLYSAGQNINIDSDGVISSNLGGTSISRDLFGSAIGALQTVSSVSAADIVPISQSGADRGISFAEFLNGLTIDQATVAGPASSLDEFWVGQGSNVLSRQSLGAIWTWICGQIPTYRIPVLEITSNTNLDDVSHNGRILLCSAPITLSAATSALGSGFQCQIINFSNGNVNLSSNFMTSSGVYTVGPQQSASVQCLTYSGGTIAYVSV